MLWLSSWALARSTAAGVSRRYGPRAVSELMLCGVVSVSSTIRSMARINPDTQAATRRVLELRRPLCHSVGWTLTEQEKGADMLNDEPYQHRYELPVVSDHGPDLHYPHYMPGEEPVQRFADVIRDAREDMGWSQDDLAEKASVSRPTINRYETGKTRTPDPETARRIFIAMRMDPRRIPVLLGYVTAEEMGLPPDGPRRFNTTIEEVIDILEDPAVGPHGIAGTGRDALTLHRLSDPLEQLGHPGRPAGQAVKWYSKRYAAASRTMRFTSMQRLSSVKA